MNGELTQEEFEIFKGYDEAVNLVCSQNERIYKAIRNVLGERFFEDFKKISGEWEFGGGIFPHKDIIVRETKGTYYKYKDDDTGKSLKKIKGFYVDEHEHGGFEGDSYSGYAYIELKKGKFLKTYYSH